MQNSELERAIEGILFAAGDSVPLSRISLALALPEDEIMAAADRLSSRFESEGRGIRLIRMEDSIQLCSAPEMADIIERAIETRRVPKLSQASLEVLAIVAYFQPVTRAYIEQIRGVDSSYTVGVLADRGLIEPRGRLDVPGRPSVYGTGEAFLRVMCISGLDELPPLPDIASEEGAQRLRDRIRELSQSGVYEQLAIEEPEQKRDREVRHI